jgi:hypothetical protein
MPLELFIYENTAEVTNMSYDIYCKGENVWEPARKVGDYFFDNIRSLEKLIEATSGITIKMADSLEIDPVIFGNFVEKALSFIEDTNNTSSVAMMSGIVEVLIGLNADINGFYPKATSKNRLLIERSKKVFYPIEDYLSG